jgi:16S rRNA G966 N2-methylase RsmD
LAWTVRGLGKLHAFAVTQVYKAEQRVFDWYSGAETRGAAGTEVDAYNAGTENWPYLGCQWPALPFVLKDLPHDGTFVDLGSGKGKVLLIAGMRPYTRVVGVEIDSELSTVARRNIERFRHRQRAGVVESVTASVVDWAVPDDTCIILMHNAFFGETFRNAMANVFASYDRNPREMHIVYMFPWEHEWLLSTGRVTVESVRSEGWPEHLHWWDDEHVTVVYHVTGEGQPVTQCRARPRRRSAAERKAMERWRNPSAHDFAVERKPM